MYTEGVTTEASIRFRFRRLASRLDERAVRLFAATEAEALGYGGVSQVSRITGLARSTILRGQQELIRRPAVTPGRIRRPGGGRKKVSALDPALVEELERLVEPLSRGDPMSPLRWTCKSIRTLAETLQGLGSHGQPPVGMGHTARTELQSPRQPQDGGGRPARRPERTVRAYQQPGGTRDAGRNPVVSVDTKKKELVGNYKNDGRKWHRKGEAPRVQGHDFPHPDVPRAYPYGIYDLARNRGHVVVGTDHDTGQFAVSSIRGWWRVEGRRLYPRAHRLLITADGGGSNGYRHRLWKLELQRLADELGYPIGVCHFPPGTSKWNKVEHRLFSFISTNWRGEPLTDYETIVRLIAKTTTAKGLVVTCRLDRHKYAVGRKISDEEMKRVNIVRDKFHGEWNYTIVPASR